MSEENKAIMRRLYEEIFNKGNLALADELIAPDVIDHVAPPGVPPGLEGAKQQFTMILAAFSDLHVTAEDMIAEGDKVASRVTFTATHKGEFMGIAPTGKRVTVTGIEIVRFAGGKMVEHWESFDNLGMMQQLGAIPPMA